MRLRKHGTSRYRCRGMIGPACWKVHDLIVLLEGSFTFHTPWPGLDIIAGDAVIIPPGVGFHATAGKQGGHVWVCHFSPGQRKETQWLHAAPSTPFWHFPGAATTPWCRALLARISESFSTGGSDRECRRLLPLLLEIVRTSSGRLLSGAIRQALAQAAELEWKGVTTERLATWAGYSPSHFRARFEQEHGQTVGRYLRNRRLEVACRLLQEATLPIKQISAQLGYSTPSAFHHAFLGVYGCTPGDYRKHRVVYH